MPPIRWPSLIRTLGLLVAAASEDAPAVWLADVTGAGEIEWCFDEPMARPVCTTFTGTTSSATTSVSTGTVSTTSDSTVTRSTTTSATSSSCFKYDDCFSTCSYLATIGGCDGSLCPTCIHAHMCDATCGYCAVNTTTTDSTTTPGTTSTETTMSETTSTSASTETFTTSSMTSNSFTTTSQTSSVSSETECFSINLQDDTFCEQACQVGGCSLGTGMCSVMFCAGCDSVFAGMCDRTCGFCTTLTGTSSSTATTESATRTTKTRSTTTTISSTTITFSTLSTGTTTVSTSTVSSTFTASSGTTDTTTATTTSESSTTTASSTTCFKYEDCLGGCDELTANGECETQYCPTCTGAHTCDMTCGICAENVTTSDTSSMSTTSMSSTTTATLSTTSVSSSTSATTDSATSTSGTSTYSITSSYSACFAVDLHPLGSAFCNASCLGVGAGCQEPCDTLFCPGCSGTEAGLCDATCGFCTTLTNTTTSVSTVSRTSRTRTTRTTSATSSVTSSTTATLSSSTKTTETTSSCFTYPDLNVNCASLAANSGGIEGTICTQLYCTTCSQAHICDTSCYICATNTTSTETLTTLSTSSSFTTDSSTTQTSSQTTESFSTTTVSTVSVTTTSETSTSATSSTTVTGTSSTGSSTGTSCFKNNSMGDDWCENNCNGDCPVDVCETNFCPTCVHAGWCDKSCDYCSNKHTSTTTSASTSTTVSSSTTMSSTTATCTPCAVDMNLPVTGCEGLLACGSTCVATTITDPCVSPMTLEFECSESQSGPLSGSTFQLGADFSSSSYVASWGAQPSNGDNMDIQWRTPTLLSVTGTFDVLCQSCGLDRYDITFDDSDPLCDRIDVTLSFGPNVLNGVVDESVVSGYAIYLVSSCLDPATDHTEFSELITSVAATPDSTAGESFNDCTCADTDKYNVPVAADLPAAGDYRLMVVPMLLDGTSMPVGLTTDIVKDYCMHSARIDIEWCFDPELPQPVCTTTATSTTSFVTSTFTSVTDSMTRTSDSSFTSPTITTTTCYKYQDCYVTCAELIGDGSLCDTMFCSSCDQAHQCDFTCGICADNVTTTRTSSTSVSTDTRTTASTTISSLTTNSLTTATTPSTTSETSTFTTTASTFSECFTIDLMGFDFCNTTTCVESDCYVDPCADLFCPNCDPPYGGMCDKTCGFCTTLTNSSTTSGTTGTLTTDTRTESTQSSSLTRSSKTTPTTTSETSTSETSSTTATSSTTVSSTSATSTSETSTSETSTSATSSTTLTSTATSSTTFTNTTSSETTDSGTTTTESSTSESTHTGSTGSECFSINLANDTFCNDTVYSNPDACDNLFSKLTTGDWVGMCDKSCGYCTTLTNTSTSESSSISRTTGSFTTTSESSSVTHTSTSTGTTSSETSSTSRTTDSPTTVTLTSSESTTTCYKYADCLINCDDLASDCETIFCPTCQSAGMCDFTCGICAANVTGTNTSTVSATTTSQTTSSVTTESTTVTISTTTGSTTSETSSTTATGTTATETACNATNLGGDLFCDASCRSDNACPKAVCETLFCLTCPFAGRCDKKCDYCTAKLTQTESSTTSRTTASTTSATSSVTQTCPPCKVNVSIPLSSGCEGWLPCGSTCQALAFDNLCMQPLLLEFECLDNETETEGIEPAQEVWRSSFNLASWNAELVANSVDNNRFSDTGFTGIYARGATLVGATNAANFDMNCQCCGIASSTDVQVWDVNCTNYDLDFEFGPNTLNGQVNESVVMGYAVFLVKQCSSGLVEDTDIENALAYVPTSASADVLDLATDQCACTGTQEYSVRLTGVFPAQNEEYRLMVSPVMLDGTVVPVGITSEILSSYCPTDTSTTSATTPPNLVIVAGTIDLATFRSMTVGEVAPIVQSGLADVFGVDPTLVSVTVTANNRRLTSEAVDGDRRLSTSFTCEWGVNCNLDCGLVYEYTASESYTQGLATYLEAHDMSVVGVGEMSFEQLTTTTVTSTSATGTTISGTGTSATATATTISGTATSASSTTLTSDTTTLTTLTSTTLTSTTLTSTTLTSITLSSTTLTATTSTATTSTATSLTSVTTSTISKTSTVSVTSASATGTTISSITTTTTPHTMTNTSSTVHTTTETTGTSATTSSTTTLTTASATSVTTASSGSDTSGSDTSTSTASSETDTSFTTISSITGTSSDTTTSETDTSETATSETATSDTTTSDTGTSGTATSDTATTTTTKRLNLEGHVDVWAPGATAGALKDSVAVPAIMEVFTVTEDQITLSVDWHESDEQGGRRLQDQFWRVSYVLSVSAPKRDDIMANFKSDVAQSEFNSKLQEFYVDASVLAFESPTTPSSAPSATPTPEPFVQVSSDTAGQRSTIGNTEASSGMIVYLLGIVAFTVLLVMMVVPCLCKRRLRRCFGAQKPNNASDKEVPTVPNNTEAVTAEAAPVDAAAVEAMGISAEEALQLGIVKPDALGPGASPLPSVRIPSSTRGVSPAEFSNDEPCSSLGDRRRTPRHSSPRSSAAAPWPAASDATQADVELGQSMPTPDQPHGLDMTQGTHNSFIA